MTSDGPRIRDIPRADDDGPPGDDSSLWERLLEQPRRLHRLATGGLLLAALVAGLDSYARSTPGGAQPDVYALTVLFDALAWALVAASAVAEAYVAGLSASR